MLDPSRRTDTLKKATIKPDFNTDVLWKSKHLYGNPVRQTSLDMTSNQDSTGRNRTMSMDSTDSAPMDIPSNQESGRRGSFTQRLIGSAVTGFGMLRTRQGTTGDGEGPPAESGHRKVSIKEVLDHQHRFLEDEDGFKMKDYIKKGFTKE
uniref:Myelin basic protein n=1 Tax=Rhabditophanes sp. KR3021 TaxID=114890 RepID=A0AC35TP66_9BILA